jgi:hypothetical protein
MKRKTSSAQIRMVSQQHTHTPLGVFFLKKKRKTRKNMLVPKKDTPEDVCMSEKKQLRHEVESSL